MDRREAMKATAALTAGCCLPLEMISEAVAGDVGVEQEKTDDGLFWSWRPRPGCMEFYAAIPDPPVDLVALATKWRACGRVNVRPYVFEWAALTLHGLPGSAYYRAGYRPDLVTVVLQLNDRSILNTQIVNCDTGKVTSFRMYDTDETIDDIIVCLSEFGHNLPAGKIVVLEDLDGVERIHATT